MFPPQKMKATAIKQQENASYSDAEILRQSVKVEDVIIGTSDKAKRRKWKSASHSLALHVSHSEPS